MGEIVHEVLWFDRFALDLRRGCLQSGGRDIDLRPKAFEVLRHLVMNAGALMSKQALYEAVWPNVSVSDDSLVQCIRELRQKLGDHEHRLIKTVSRRGYLLDASVSTSPPAAGGPSAFRPGPSDHVAAQSGDPDTKLAATFLAFSRLARGKPRSSLAAAVALVFAFAAGAYLLASSAKFLVRHSAASMVAHQP